MSDCFCKSDLRDFCDLMMLPDGTPIIPVDMLDWLARKGFFRSPASTRFHGATEGGLYRHSASVMRFLVQLTKDNGLHWQRKISPYIVGMFHDLCKIDQYRCERQENTILWEYNPDTLFKGHGEKSVMLLSQFFQLTEEEIACIRYHMGAFTPEKEWNDYTRAVKMCPMSSGRTMPICWQAMWKEFDHENH